MHSCTGFLILFGLHDVKWRQPRTRCLIPSQMEVCETNLSASGPQESRFSLFSCAQTNHLHPRVVRALFFFLKRTRLCASLKCRLWRRRRRPHQEDAPLHQKKEEVYVFIATSIRLRCFPSEIMVWNGTQRSEGCHNIPFRPERSLKRLFGGGVDVWEGNPVCRGFYISWSQCAWGKPFIFIQNLFKMLRSTSGKGKHINHRRRRSDSPRLGGDPGSSSLTQARHDGLVVKSDWIVNVCKHRKWKIFVLSSKKIS